MEINTLVDHHPLESIDFGLANQSYLIEASAGTGKTWTIEHLFIKALLESSLPNTQKAISLNNILVVTFTNDATNELKERIQIQIQNTLNQIIYLQNSGNCIKDQNPDPFSSYLQARHQQYDYQKDVQVLNRALQNFDVAAIFTIHGFCNRILKDYQFEAQVNSSFDLTANRSSIIQELVLNFLRTQIITKQEFSKNLDLVMANLEQFFTGSDWSSTLIERIANKIPKDLFWIKNGEYQVRYTLDEPSIPFIDVLNATLDDSNIRELKTEFLLYLINYIRDNYQKYCVETNSLSYDEMIQKVADSVATNQQLADKIFAAYPVAFIDEFQDTDSLQWQIFSNIYHLNHKVHRGQIVVVGDPKQAVYRFRGADINTYLNAREHIARTFKLTTNFRSTPNIVNFINRLFKQGMGNIDSCFGNGISYNEIKVHDKSRLELPTLQSLEDFTTNKGVVNAKFYTDDVQIVSITGKTKDVRQSNLLKSLTFEILALLNVNPSLKGKIAILVTKNREAYEIVNYLRHYGVQATELKLGNIFATNTAHDLYKILFALFDLTNRRAFTNALTSSIFNLPLVKLGGMVDNGGNSELEKMQQRFFLYKKIWHDNGIFSLLYRIISDLIDDKSKPHLTNRDLANFWQLAELLNKEDHKLANNAELLLWFKDKMRKAASNLSNDGDIDGNNEELIRLDNDEEQILVTTQHKSKGLEFDIVFCPYFKGNITLDGLYDYNYRRPFFSNYTLNNKSHAELIMDEKTGYHIVNDDNKEAHRLNYVSLTRAKSRLYIYLKQPTRDKTGKKYNANQKPEKIVELFGYVKDNPDDTSHQLFDYAKLFGMNPISAIKDPALLPGVTAYNRDDIKLNDLESLSLPITPQERKLSSDLYVGNMFKAVPSYTRQSYSGLVRVTDTQEHEYYEAVIEDPITSIEMADNTELGYRYTILADKNLSGATFGTLFHSLCEEYPFTPIGLNNLLIKYNISDAEYSNELMQMLEEAFNYHILDKKSLNKLTHKIHELEFNLLIEQSVSLKGQIAGLISDYFGETHPFTLACNNLGTIEQGFLVGFIDLCFAHKGKYWVLDYKTNKLDGYCKALAKDHNGYLIASMADHHYYLQYLLYLVALKRYLEKRLNVDDATDLIGGAVYYYVRGIYTTNLMPGDGVYLDKSCQTLIRNLDNLLKPKKIKLTKMI